ncbi:hypothetical protein [Microlunatus speluncae]|uniref:hypothetical protein n=1 Tax=Microlunatus speluncae TaxID=2594267 RepID=UPI0012663B87|nr:hypothetical protein [Microlunatus speluncae]
MGARKVLDIAVSDDLVERWRGWFAPPRQPFPLDPLDPAIAASVPVVEGNPTDEVTDTFSVYRGTWTWLDEAEFDALPYRSRRALLAARRRAARPKFMPAWPSELAREGDELLLRWVASHRRPSQHASVPESVWRRANRLLPEAKRLAGTFPASGSGPNCFGNVLAAAGVPDTETVKVFPDQFQTWLDRQTEPVRGTGHDHEPGTVLYWTEHGQLAHAALTVGDGWVLNKPSQAWSCPRLVWTVRDLINGWKYPTTRLYRRRITG